ncbi:MAG: PEP-CTERM sorting domain-containing protein [Gemmatimonadaceae bacterium]|nr:PEP-CTERM sorting domain-containing protein [Gemmatimonadaceae bacterium]
MLGAVALMASLAGRADAQMIGDMDCFGTVFGTPTTCGPTFNIPGIPTDGRSAAEQAATNGAQQTDFYSSNFTPLPTSFNLRWSIGTPLAAGASITYRAYGLQADDFSPFITQFNGVTETGFLDFQDGATAVATRTFNLSAGAISRANLAGELVVNINRGNSNDAVAFDYFRLNGTTVVPEPSTYALMATGLIGLVGIARRRRA